MKYLMEDVTVTYPRGVLWAMWVCVVSAGTSGILRFLVWVL